MKTKLLIAILLLCNISFAQCPANVGVYYWGGQLNGVDTSLIIHTAKLLADSLGVNTIRITLACNDDAVYKNGGACLSGMNLTSLASRADFNSIITDPQFTTVIITAYDWASFNDCSTTNFLDSTFYTPQNIDSIETELKNFATYLSQFSDKLFIITNWEGDNQIYCGAAYYDPNCPSAPANLVGFTKWMQYRSAGVAAANAPNVKYGIEFCNIHSLENLGKPSVLDNVIPNVTADYFLYSAYESFNISSEQLDTDIYFVRNKLIGFGKDPNALLIGEMGFGTNDWGNAQNAADSLQNTVNVVIQKQIPYSITWVLIDSPTNFGMYDSLGLITPQGTVLKNSVCQTTSVNEINKESFQLKIVPNPNDGAFKLSFNIIEVTDVAVEISDVIGQSLYKAYLKEINGNTTKTIELRSLPEGVYFINLKSDKDVETKKIIIGH